MMVDVGGDGFNGMSRFTFTVTDGRIRDAVIDLWAGDVMAIQR